MKSILTALQEGRLIELPETDKEKALRYLATILEAIPDVSANVDVAEGVLEREKSANTGIGRGWACPHIRVDGDGELFSVLGWSPAGIDYGAPDGNKVHLLVMYYIPGNQRMAYLKELSGLAKSIQAGRGIENIEKAAALNDVRNELLNWVSASIDTTMPQAKARMIKLEAKQALAAEQALAAPQALERLVPLYLLAGAGPKHIALSQDAELVKLLEAAEIGPIGEKQDFEAGSYKVFVRSRSAYKADRVLYDCIAVKR
ncbi:MAG: PTS sugar transporter subunit IIA [Elusimicrobia bacterium]|nr:PTS sugar transporter subunit IIA [Elusimicrobiota bacterium]